MNNKLNELIETLRSLGYKDYVISQQKSGIIIKFPNIKEIHVSEETKLIKEFGVTIDVTDSEITIIY